MTTTAVGPRRTGSRLRRAFPSSADRYRALLGRRATVAAVPDYLRIFDAVGIATVAARGVRLAARQARGAAEEVATLEVLDRRTGEIVGHRVGAELYAAATVLGEYLALPATDQFVADMADVLARERRYELRTDVEMVMLTYRLLLLDPGGGIENML
ncbi:hypothetical protein SAMN02745947_05490 [Rhodococcus rhodochrous J3]|uniref:Uncharacterized protein n=1 Tax=Rhodococcus rhodochrous J3 TaxID=903528 RepID=A0ABY1MJE9_RHORH|nr:hypothetical protein [Rhodococcus rhodochrous]MBF4476802.1 hypothetical protein [Rhodococcus rhodochrous]MCD2099970.1 hypothetical protein [Rhodococcus rhodochrous]MCD2124368.1 hypothetical protein [Rhodococcus rhodochrous]MDJ0021094.1 hypothetical protein [Rhodococcus rhodochrous]SMG59763.1 hypothetical protein SAMN02745947_05490 [Rhodococcus rhodochrous J3]